MAAAPPASTAALQLPGRTTAAAASRSPFRSPSTNPSSLLTAEAHSCERARTLRPTPRPGKSRGSENVAKHHAAGQDANPEMKKFWYWTLFGVETAGMVFILYITL